LSKNLLFITYDGLTDPLGQSQILPYFMALSQKGHQVTILSAEKPESYEKSGSAVRSLLTTSGIEWVHVDYQNKIPILSTLITIFKMKEKGIKLAKKKGFSLYHCRSIIPTLIGFSVKKRFPAPLVYDIRGFWADERIDGKLWNLNHPMYRIIYRFFKKREEQAYQRADRIVTLTKAAREVLEQNYQINREKIAVVPCMADLEHFNPEKIDYSLREKLIRSDEKLKSKLIVGYCGSLGTRYMLEEMIRFFKCVRELHKQAIFYVITKSDRLELNQLIKLEKLEESVVVQAAEYNEMPSCLSLIDVALYFIFKGNSGKAVSPTKQAEFLGMGIPIITNAGIGDSQKIIQGNNVGIVVEAFEEETLRRAAQKVPDLMELEKDKIRLVAERNFSLEKGVETYHNLYSEL